MVESDTDYNSLFKETLYIAVESCYFESPGEITITGKYYPSETKIGSSRNLEFREAEKYRLFDHQSFINHQSISRAIFQNNFLLFFVQKYIKWQC